MSSMSFNTKCYAQIHKQRDHHNNKINNINKFYIHNNYFYEILIIYVNINLSINQRTKQTNNNYIGICIN